MIVAGIGCRRGASVESVLEAVQMALEHSGLTRSSLDAFAVPEDKSGEHGILDAAHRLSLRVIVIPDQSLREAGSGTLTTSERVLALKGVASVAEAAALAGAGDGARLMAPRSATANVTCALASGGTA